jgi:hypothetical protein
MSFRLKVLATAAALALSAHGAASDAILETHDASPTVSVGFSWVFGQGFGVGAKIFSTDRSGRGAATLGMDYLFTGQRWRPNVGVAYLKDGGFVGLNMGFGEGGLDFGLGLGPVDTSEGGRPTT